MLIPLLFYFLFVFMHMLYFDELFFKALLDDCVITIQIFDFKKSIITIKRFLVMILNLFLTSE